MLTQTGNNQGKQRTFIQWIWAKPGSPKTNKRESIVVWVKFSTLSLSVWHNINANTCYASSNFKGLKHRTGLCLLAEVCPCLAPTIHSSSGLPLKGRLGRDQARLPAEVRLLQEEGCHGGLREASVQEELPPAVWNGQQLIAAVFWPGSRAQAKTFRESVFNLQIYWNTYDSMEYQHDTCLTILSYSTGY